MSSVTPAGSPCFQIIIFLLGINIFILAVYNTSGRLSLSANVITSHPPPAAYSDFFSSSSSRPPPPTRPILPLVPATSSIRPAVVDVVGNNKHNNVVRSRISHEYQQQQRRGQILQTKIVVPPPPPSRKYGEEDDDARSVISLRQLSSSVGDESSSRRRGAFDSLMELRTRRIRDYCQERRMTLTSLHAFSNIILVRDNNILWCPVFKASSSTWLHHLLEISKLPEGSSIHPSVRRNGLEFAFLAKTAVTSSRAGPVAALGLLCLSRRRMTCVLGKSEKYIPCEPELLQKQA